MEKIVQFVTKACLLNQCTYWRQCAQTLQFLKKWITIISMLAIQYIDGHDKKVDYFFNTFTDFSMPLFLTRGACWLLLVVLNVLMSRVLAYMYR